MERGRWAEAETAFDEAVRARPLNSGVRSERGRFFLTGSQTEKAVANFREAIRLMPDNLAMRRDLILTLLSAGEHAAIRRAISDLLDYFRDKGDRSRMMAWGSDLNRIAWSCILDPSTVADTPAPVQMAEMALRDCAFNHRPTCLNTLGAALYRVGRYDDAILRLEEGIRLRKGVEVPQEWVFLSMAHAQLGRRDEALRWLDRFQTYRPSEDPEHYWDEVEIRLLRREADAVVLHGPVFPIDPFAPH
jgi:tetratricopeptide (TPR) repeat protein